MTILNKRLCFFVEWLPICSGNAKSHFFLLLGLTWMRCPWARHPTINCSECVCQRFAVCVCVHYFILLNVLTYLDGLNAQDKLPYLAFTSHHFSLSLSVMPNEIVFISDALFAEVIRETALFLQFHKCHLLSESGFTFLFSLSASFVQTNAKIRPIICSKVKFSTF